MTKDLAKHLAHAEINENRRLESIDKLYHKRQARHESEKDERLIRFEVMREERRQAKAKAIREAKSEARRQRRIALLSPKGKQGQEDKFNENKNESSSRFHEKI